MLAVARRLLTLAVEPDRLNGLRRRPEGGLLQLGDGCRTERKIALDCAGEVLRGRQEIAFRDGRRLELNRLTATIYRRFDTDAIP